MTQILPKTTVLFGMWILAVVLVGAVLTSFHQPFQSPEAGILAIAGSAPRSGWRAIHVLSGSCACSQRVMRHLLERSPLEGAVEQVVIIDGTEPYLDGSKELLERVAAKGMRVTHWPGSGLPQQLGLRGVPLLILAAPDGRVLYLGGYGSRENQDVEVFRRVREGAGAPRLPVLGCAVGTRLRRSVDPFRLKY